MTSINVTEVFGIHKKVKSYIERSQVDGLFKLALQSDKQILVYGASKQGKTALVSNYCGYDKHILYQLTPETELIDIYQHMLREAGVVIRTEYTEGKGTAKSLNVRAKIAASFAIFVKGELSTNISGAENKSTSKKYEEIPFNISQPQEIASLLKRVRNKKLIILENFHYLTYENQKKFAFDLRSFQELGVRFIILGVWKERNRMAQFNGDLLDRVKEVPVEPWLESDFQRIVKKGESILKIKLSERLITELCRASFSSVGVFQDLLLEVCVASEVLTCQKEVKNIDDGDFLQKIIQDKADSYGARHRRVLEAIASVSQKNNKNKLYYHIVDLLLSEGYEGIKHGMHKEHIHECLRKKSQGHKLKSKVVKIALEDIHNIQSNKSIMPPVLSYDENSELLNITDSTLYFFLKNANLIKFREQLKSSYATRI